MRSILFSHGQPHGGLPDRTVPPQAISRWCSPVSGSVHQTQALLTFLLLQLIVMIGAARLGNTVLHWMGQPGVVGEILAGLLLGLSLFGHFFPETSHALCGEHAAAPITIISQIGLILLMFQIGMDFQFGHLQARRNIRAVAAVTLASIGVPLGSGLLIGRLSRDTLAPGIDPVIYSLFCGVGLAITAVPILGRILREYGLTRSEGGVVAITAAAVNDRVGWILLAGVSAYAMARFSSAQVVLQLAGRALFALAVWFVVRPLISRILARGMAADGTVPPNLMAGVIRLMFAAGICTYRLGIFAIFGGFVAGLLFHRHEAFVRPGTARPVRPDVLPASVLHLHRAADQRARPQCAKRCAVAHRGARRGDPGESARSTAPHAGAGSMRPGAGYSAA